MLTIMQYGRTVYNVNMVDLKKKQRAELNTALELLHFGFRSITSHPDQCLSKLGYSRVHQRVLYFIARNNHCSINELLAIMRVSKQYLHRPLKQLVDDGYVTSEQDSQDRRIKRLALSKKGARLEEKLTGEQRQQLAGVFDKAGSQAEAGWRKIMTLLATELEQNGNNK